MRARVVEGRKSTRKLLLKFRRVAMRVGVFCSYENPLLREKMTPHQENRLRSLVHAKLLGIPDSENGANGAA